MMPETMRFSCSENAFHIDVARCVDLECECADLFFTLREVGADGSPVPDGQTLAIRVDGETWQEVAAPLRDDRSAQIVRELLNQYPAKGREHLQRQMRQKRGAARRLRDYRIPLDLLETGQLIAFGEIISDRHSGADPWSFAYEWEHDGDYYLLEDRYCGNPVCNCRNIYVSFFLCGTASETKQDLKGREMFLAILSLDGTWRIDECYKCTEAEAKSLLRAWRQDEPDHLEYFRWRYEKVKEIGRRSYRRRGQLSEEAARTLGPFMEPPARLPFQLPDDGPVDGPEDETPERPVAGVVRVGRNEPCPCGSGKKYKKCCGKGGTPRE